MKKTVLALLLCLALSPGVVLPEDLTTVVTSGLAEVQVPAGRVRVQLSIESHDRTASKAAEEVARLNLRVASALSELGLEQEAVPTAGYSVEPHFDWDNNRIDGYGASTGVSLVLEDPDTLGAVIDRALSAGANGVSSVTYLAADERQARDEALRQAFESARRDALVLAEAAGGRLGRLIEITTPTYQTGEIEELITVTAQAAALGTRLVPPKITISARVNTKWEVAGD